MIDEKKLIEELHEIRKTYDTKHADKFDKGVVAGIDTAIHLLVTADKAGKWIPVEDGLPNYNEPVLVTYLYYPNQKIYDDEIAYLDVCGNWDWDTKEEIESAEIMAWMRLPEPYVEGEEKNERL